MRSIDVVFWVRPSGRVEEAEVLSGKPSCDWATAVTSPIEARRCAATS